jgi:hypothetical protein
MGEDPGTAGAPVTETREPEAIRRDIEATRRELGDTVAALAAKTDIKGQARHKVDDVKASISANPLPVVIAGGVVAGFVAWRLRSR